MGFWESILTKKYVANDGGLAEDNPNVSTGDSFPWTTPQRGQRAIGTLFPTEIDNETLTDMYTRYQLGRRIIDMPIEEALMFHPTILIDGKENLEAQRLYIKSRPKWLRFFKLVRLYGHSEMIIGFNDPIPNWSQPVQDGTQFSWIQPVPLYNEVELKESDSIPVKIEYLQASFGETTLMIDPSRFIHSMNPKIHIEDKIGESVLLPIANLLQVQIHADWSIGQALWRRAGGLLGIFAPRRRMEAEEIDGALQSVNNHNSKTVVYVPFGWNIKEILRTSGNIAIARTYAVILEQIAAGCGIPLSVLTGQKSGGLNAGSEDQETYNRYVSSIQNNTIEPVLTQFMRFLQKANFLPPGKVEIVFPALENVTQLQKETEMTEIGALRLLQRRMEEEEIKPGTFSTEELVKVIGRGKKR